MAPLAIMIYTVCAALSREWRLAGTRTLCRCDACWKGYSEDDILREWHSILPECMQRWQLDRQGGETLFTFVCDAEAPRA